MDIIFKTEALKRQMNQQKRLQRRYGAPAAKRLQQRLHDLRAAETLEVMRTLPGRCHELKADRAGQLAMDLDGPYRLVFEPANEPVLRKPDGGLSWSEVTVIRILAVREDYHD